MWNTVVFPQANDVLEQEHTVSVEIDGEPLKGVGWKEVPDLITTGEFLSSEIKLSPQKRGYRFSPDIFNFDDYDADSAKVFRAYKYQIEDKLKFHLPFQEQLLENILQKRRATPIDIQYKKSEKGTVAYFNGATSYIDFGSDNTNFQELTIAVWLKPEKVDGSNSIIGKGEVFSAKIFDGNLQFTTPGIKDHISDAMRVTSGKWIHIAFVYMPNDKVFFYQNGKLIDKQEASTIANTDHSILIGSNLWGQYYKGMMSDFAMWNRTLSDDEILEVYTSGIPIQHTQSETSIWLFVVIGLFVFGILAILLIKRAPFARKKKIKYHNVTSTNYHIQLLGGFVLKSLTKMEDVSHHLSPKRKELFILLLLFTIKDGGISSKKMGEILWPNFSPASMKNNRSTQIKELRKVFGRKLPMNIVFSDKKWQMEIPENIKTDIVALKALIPGLFLNKSCEIDRANLVKITHLVRKGPFLPQMDFEWLDSFKADYGNTILDVLTPYVETKNKLGSDVLLNIIEAILVIDPLYEPAVKKKIQLFIEDGKHASAQKIMKSYKKLYESFYKESYDIKMLNR
ncbi:hypothetical protein OOZ15_15235 [Galbibacter sp. EGI 63066]|uniref:LamG domain-containing protein n=1 Tax=Galbibacter sp. EGI 63066 TaxID=2993559 RepID=UPI002249469D|nr:LamG-like jellyroll fold domain-containing protein [Galbibacter sp. EGI 63066]MCX2681305.1 hypothetical protein [Galbibacter sp. EGI 63066]